MTLLRSSKLFSHNFDKTIGPIPLWVGITITPEGQRGAETTIEDDDNGDDVHYQDFSRVD